MKTKLFFGLIFLCNYSYAQQVLNLSLNNSCSYIEAPITGSLYTFKSDQEGLEIINKITSALVIPPNFELVESNVPSALATIDNGRRVIVYSANFLQKLKERTNTNWAAVSVLAHEIGHHLSGHTLDNQSTRPQEELEADKFSGRILALLGASLEDAQIAVETLCPNDATDYYPPKSARLEAIANGWKTVDPGRFGAFSIFLSTFPRDINAKVLLVNNYFWSGSGVIHINGAETKITVSGDLDFNVTSPSGDIVKTIKGTLNGFYYLQDSDNTSKFPLSFDIPLTGDAIFAEKNPVSQNRYSFKSLHLSIYDVNHVEGKVNFSSGNSQTTTTVSQTTITVPFVYQ